jgi:hypothetical protein
MPRALTQAPPAVLAAAAAIALAAGCGNERTPVPEVSAPEPPQGRRIVDLPQDGITYRAPGNWRDVARADPLVGGVQSRRGTLAIWRYPRTQPLPDTTVKLRRVRDLLVERVRARDPTFELARSRLTRRGGARAIELTGAQTVAGRRVQVHSAHVFGEGAEVVLDAYAPPADFARVDRTVFEPLLSSLELRAPGT